jgi:hypothetical protein
MALNPEQVVTFEMQVKEWDVVFQALADIPYRHSNPIIQKLGQQLQRYGDSPPASGMTVNGSGAGTEATS